MLCCWWLQIRRERERERHQLSDRGTATVCSQLDTCIIESFGDQRLANACKSNKDKLLLTDKTRGISRLQGGIVASESVDRWHQATNDDAPRQEMRRASRLQRLLLLRLQLTHP